MNSTRDIDYTDPAKIQEIGIEALKNALGTVGMVYFLRQNRHGDGIYDYTAERQEHLREDEFTDEEIINIVKFQTEDIGLDSLQSNKSPAFKLG
jgi:hypothetical protein